MEIKTKFNIDDELYAIIKDKVETVCEHCGSNDSLPSKTSWTATSHKYPVLNVDTQSDIYGITVHYAVAGYKLNKEDELFFNREDAVAECEKRNLNNTLH